jgi:hypothetical protein
MRTGNLRSFPKPAKSRPPKKTVESPELRELRSLTRLFGKMMHAFSDLEERVRDLEARFEFGGRLSGELVTRRPNLWREETRLGREAQALNARYVEERLARERAGRRKP